MKIKVKKELSKDGNLVWNTISLAKNSFLPELDVTLSTGLDEETTAVSIEDGKKTEGVRMINVITPVNAPVAKIDLRLRSLGPVEDEGIANRAEIILRGVDGLYDRSELAEGVVEQDLDGYQVNEFSEGVLYHVEGLNKGAVVANHDEKGAAIPGAIFIMVGTAI